MSLAQLDQKYDQLAAYFWAYWSDPLRDWSRIKCGKRPQVFFNNQELSEASSEVPFVVTNIEFEDIVERSLGPNKRYVQFVNVEFVVVVEADKNADQDLLWLLSLIRERYVGKRISTDMRVVAFDMSPPYTSQNTRRTVVAVARIEMDDCD